MLARKSPRNGVSGPNRIVIVGQGIAGTALGLELEEAGVEFSVVGDTHADAASRVAAGLITPVTGQRFVKSWRVDEFLPIAKAKYAGWEAKLGVRLWHDVEIRRLFADNVEATRAEKKFRSGELGDYVSDCNREGITIRGGAWVDLEALLKATRERWVRGGTLVEGRWNFVGPDLASGLTFVRGQLAPRADARPDARSGPTLSTRMILCVGAGELVRKYFPALRVVPVKGEVITVVGGALDVRRVLHRGVWVRPESTARARVGATYEPGKNDIEPTNAARNSLLQDASSLTGGSPRVVAHDAGVRLVADDRLPVAGWSEVDRNVGILGVLGSKGALWAPWLARIWAQHLASGSSLDSVVSPQRFGSVGDSRP